MAASVQKRLDEAEVRRLQAEAETQEGRLIVDKVNCLRLLLAESYLKGTEGSKEWVPVLDPKGAEVVTDKLLELVNKF
jgi:hypothetical protein